MYQAGKTIWKSYASFKDGMTFHRRAFEIIYKYDEPCQKSSQELEKAGITKERYHKMYLWNDNSIEGISFSIWAMVDYIISRRKNRNHS